jgi:predicted Zn-ribbon and HTH transcriptional regulator
MTTSKPTMTPEELKAWKKWIKRPSIVSPTSCARCGHSPSAHTYTSRCNWCPDCEKYQ